MTRRLSAGVRGLMFGVMALVALCSAQGAAQSGGGDAAAAKKHFGSYAGTWEGGGQSGGFEITLEAGKDGKPGGTVATTGEPAYKATIKTLAFDGAKMTATYDFPPDPSVLVTLTATFEGNAAKGMWAAKGGEIDAMSGTWTVKKK